MLVDAAMQQTVSALVSLSVSVPTTSETKQVILLFFSFTVLVGLPAFFSSSTLLPANGKKEISVACLGLCVPTKLGHEDGQMGTQEPIHPSHLGQIGGLARALG